MENEVAVRDTTFDGIKPERIWLTVSNCGGDRDRLEIILEINGIERVIQSHYIPGLDRNEGVTFHSTNLSWLLENAL